MKLTSPILLAGGVTLLALVAPAQDDGEPETPAEQRARELAELEQRYFVLCDANADGWISYPEASAALGLERARFRRYDADGDGRLERAEFAARYRDMLARLGALDALLGEGDDEAATAFEGPAATTGPLPTFPDAERLLATYDADKSEGLSAAELRRLFDEQRLALSLDVVLEQMDPNQTGELEIYELVPLGALVEAHLIVPLDAAPESVEERRARFDRLFAETTPRWMEGTDTSIPPHIAGPTSHFRRLDIYGDGRIDAEDLRELTAPAQIAVRPTAVLGALDLDGDGALTPTEFRAALED